MANHKSSLKRIRNSESKRLRNRYQAKTMRNAIRNFRELTDKAEAGKALPKLASMLDRLAKKNVIHKNKAANLKSELAVHLNHIK
jgi:small subunit ribosomal protein S20